MVMYFHCALHYMPTVYVRRNQVLIYGTVAYVQKINKQAVPTPQNLINDTHTIQYLSTFIFRYMCNKKRIGYFPELLS